MAVWAALGIALFLVSWAPALTVPFWQDDFGFLDNARQAVKTAQPWFSDFWGDGSSCFWRPVSVGLYWRFVEQVLGGNAFAAHVLNLFLLLAASASVGWLTATFLRIRFGDDGRDHSRVGNRVGQANRGVGGTSVAGRLANQLQDVIESKRGLRVPPMTCATLSHPTQIIRDSAAAGGLLAAFLYGIHSCHFLSVAWGCGSQESFVVLFCALTLRYWLVAITTVGRRANWAAAAVVAGTVAALLSKEVAAVLPALEAILAVAICGAGVPPARAAETAAPQKPIAIFRRLLSRQNCLLAACSIGVTLLWWLVHRRLVSPASPPYRMALGWNVLRNAACLGLFALNVPREAIRFTIEKHSLAACLWGISCLGVQVVGCAWLLRGRPANGNRRDACALAAFFAAALAPHLFLAWNCYAYYASIALLAYAILVGWAAGGPRLASSPLKKGTGSELMGATTTKNDGREAPVPLFQRAARAAIGLLVVAAAVSTLGNYVLDYPALVARARWANRQLEIIRSLAAANPTSFQRTIYVKVEDDRKFQGFAFRAWPTRWPCPRKRSSSSRPANCAGWPRGPTIVVPQQGDVYLELPQQNQ